MSDLENVSSRCRSQEIQLSVYLFMILAETHLRVQLCMYLCISSKSFKVNCIVSTVSEEFGYYVCTKQFSHNYKYSYVGCCNATIMQVSTLSRHKQDNCEVYSPGGQGY